MVKKKSFDKNSDSDNYIIDSEESDISENEDTITLDDSDYINSNEEEESDDEDYDEKEEESYEEDDSDNDSQEYDSDNDSQECEEHESQVNNEDEESINLDTKLNDNWILWYHHEKNNWKISGYRKIYKIETIKDFWELYKNFDRIGGINNQHFFLMREGIEPIWEDKKNQSGGCWSFKKMENESAQLWEDLSVRIVGENLLENNMDINGLSICLKRQSNSVIKIWNNNSKNNQINLLSKDILNKYGKDILYIAHIPEF